MIKAYGCKQHDYDFKIYILVSVFGPDGPRVI